MLNILLHLNQDKKREVEVKSGSWIVALSIFFIFQYGYAEDKQIVVLVPSYNNARWYQKNLDSVFMQTYNNYRVLYIDDCSTDNTADLVEAYVAEQGFADRVTVIRNEERRRAMANIYAGVHMCQDKEIVVMLDGDDWLANDRVFELLNLVYQQPNVWLTFGNFRMHSRGYSWGGSIPTKVVRGKQLRSFQPGPSHLRTFYAGLFKKIRREDLCRDGEFYAYTYDLAMMFPMIEMAGDRYQFIGRVLYIYNDHNPINDHKIDKQMQREIDLEIRSKTPYERIETLFDDEIG